jgi:heme-degrading monooxygenase HmoA
VVTGFGPACFKFSSVSGFLRSLCYLLFKILFNVILTIFRSRLRPEHHTEYEAMAARMDELAKTMPGFISIKTFTAPDGERVSLVEFDSEANHQAWRQHPAHREAQRLGRERFYSEFQIQVCKVERAHGMPPKVPQQDHAKS